MQWIFGEGMRDLLAHVATIVKFQFCAWVNIKYYDKDGFTDVHVQSPCSQQALVYVNVFVFCLHEKYTMWCQEKKDGSSGALDSCFGLVGPHQQSIQ